VKRRWAEAAIAVGAMLTVSGPVGAGSANAAEPCGTHLSGGLSADGTYGGHGVVRSCGNDGSRRGGSPIHDILRTVTSEPSLCAGTPDARLETLRTYDRGTGALIRTTSRCVGPNVPGDPEPPPPPAPEEALRRAPLPSPGINTSPPGRGLVGFATHLWWDAVTDLPPVTVSVGEWSATVTPVLLGITWDLGNGDRVAGNGPGSEDSPSAIYTYERQCDCTITMTARWGGSVSFSHPLLAAPITVESPPVEFSISTAYDVVEREAVVVG
jgi:hypothetical protein